MAVTRRLTTDSNCSTGSATQ